MMIVTKEHIIYTATPVVLVAGSIVWSGAHSVAALLLGLLVIMIPLLYFVVNAAAFDDYWVKRQIKRGPELHLEDSPEIISAKVKHYSTLSEANCAAFYSTLCHRVRSKSIDVVALVRSGIMRHIIARMTHNPLKLEEAVVGMDVLNAILYTRDVRSELDSPEVKHLIREAVIVLRSALKELKGDALAVTSSAADGASMRSNEHHEADLMYKGLLFIGLLCDNNVQSQFIAVDEACVPLALDAINRFPRNEKVAKWACWSLTTLVSNHPPNKFEFVTNRGVPAILRVLERFCGDATVQLQGLGLLLNVFAEDHHSLYDTAKLRESALHDGLNSILEKNIGRFKKDAPLVALCCKIQEAYVNSTWS